MQVKFYTILTTLACLAGAHSASAQFSIGPRLGLNLADVALSGDLDGDTDTKISAGVQVGVAATIGLADKFAFQPALLYSQKGFKREQTETETFGGITYTASFSSKASFNYLEVPLNFVFTTGGENGFQVFAGPYLAYGVGGKTESKYSVKDANGTTYDSGSENKTVKFADKEGSDDYSYVRALDLGLNGGLGYRQGPFQAQVGYGLGLGNLIPQNENGDEYDYKARNRVIQVSATYFFSVK
ncbi:porin family protein [Hymenobacter sp. ASUV-10]|uniref:Porin family protein n=1 Tax=Hymenobacter aranciens TaxID=3063996 RepID=A0ABT9BA62_9BACT|nr:porin family protein [Hymenobacter sp. ASUV-10]MDO7874538.1 porin family protein [Hymenobacter sp. ASUV-10]